MLLHCAKYNLCLKILGIFKVLCCNKSLHPIQTRVNPAWLHSAGDQSVKSKSHLDQTPWHQQLSCFSCIVPHWKQLVCSVWMNDLSWIYEWYVREAGPIHKSLAVLLPRERLLCTLIVFLVYIPVCSQVVRVCVRFNETRRTGRTGSEAAKTRDAR